MKMKIQRYMMAGTIVGSIAIVTDDTLAASEKNMKDGKPRLNILLFTADDLGWTSVGCYGSGLDVTPNIDRFAGEGVLFENGYVNAAISSPSRKIIMTGMYGHNSGAMGFDPIDRTREVPVLADILAKNGFRTGILGKLDHSNPYDGYEWDFCHDSKELGRGRNPDLYEKYVSDFISGCKDDNVPFFFMVNSDDPHRPFFNPDDPKSLRDGIKMPSRLYSPEEISVPGFLPDTKMTREEMAYYYNSTRRLDDTFGAVMKVLEESGLMENTIIVFLSDNGIAMPFAKANVYYASNRVPFIVKWPGHGDPGVRNSCDFVNEADLMPTFLDILGIDIPKHIDGKSFKRILNGKYGHHRNHSFHQIDKKISGPAVPMRSIVTADYIYIFNAWSDGKRFYTNNNEGQTMKSLEQLAKTDDFARERVGLFRYRVAEEFYNLKNDKSCLHNLIDSPSYHKEINKYRKLLEKEMVEHRDTLLPVFQVRNNTAQKEKVMKQLFPSMK